MFDENFTLNPLLEFTNDNMPPLIEFSPLDSSSTTTLDDSIHSSFPESTDMISIPLTSVSNNQNII